MITFLNHLPSTSAPLPIALNIASKILAFAAATTLFLPQPPAPGHSFQVREARGVPASGACRHAGRRSRGPD